MSKARPKARPPAHVVPSPVNLSMYLAEHGLPGYRSKTSIMLLRRERAKRNAPLPALLPVEVRAHHRLMQRICDEIHRRGGETWIEGKYKTAYLEPTDKRDGLVLVHAEGWRSYGKAPARMARLSYLWGRDDAGSGPWAVRVPGSITTVTDALDWLTPAPVHRALAKGLRVRRQGDVFAIETTRTRDGHGLEDLPGSHVWRPATRYLVHRPEDDRRHRPLCLPWPVQFVRQTAYEMGRTNTRGNAD